MFTQWKSYLSLKTSVIVIILTIWNGGMLLTMSVFGNSSGSKITPEMGLSFSIFCLLLSIFGFSVAMSENVRNKLIEPSRLQSYRKQDFLLMGYVGFALSICMYVFPRISHA